MSDFFPEPDHERDAEPARTPRRVALGIYSLILVLISVVCTIAIVGQNHPDSGEPGAASTPPPFARPNFVPLSFGATDTAVATVKVPAGTSSAALLHFDIAAEGSPTSAPRAAMISARVECSSADDPVEMQMTGKVSTNVFIAQGGSVSGQALTAETQDEMECTLLASAPFIETTDDGLTSLPLRAALRIEPTDGAHILGLHWLDDATLLEPGVSKNVLSRQIEDPATLDRMSSTVRLTSCTVTGGSRDGDGANKCRESMTGKESSTVRIRVTARWLDTEGNIESTSTYWDETLAIDYSTHHVPWNLRQEGMADQVPKDAAAVVLVVQVESLAGTPVVVHADGTDSVITTRA